MSHSTDNHTAPCCWLVQVLERAYPQSAGVTMAALESLSSSDTFTGAQLAYVAQLMFNAGAQARTDGDRAEIAAACAANFEPQPTREARIAMRVAAMGEQHEIAWLRRYGRAPELWPGGTEAEALEHYGWDADRPEPDLGPSAARWRPDAGVPTRQRWDRATRARRYEWRDEA